MAATCQPDRCEVGDRGDIKTVGRKREGRERERERPNDYIVPKKIDR